VRNVIFLGLVSFFADVSTDMVYPLVPLYRTALMPHFFLQRPKGATL
jgi:hypothetical protein